MPPSRNPKIFGQKWFLGKNFFRKSLPQKNFWIIEIQKFLSKMIFGKTIFLKNFDPKKILSPNFDPQKIFGSSKSKNFWPRKNHSCWLIRWSTKSEQGFMSYGTKQVHGNPGQPNRRHGDDRPGIFGPMLTINFLAGGAQPPAFMPHGRPGTQPDRPRTRFGQ